MDKKDAKMVDNEMDKLKQKQFNRGCLNTLILFGVIIFIIVIVLFAIFS